MKKLALLGILLLASQAFAMGRTADAAVIWLEAEQFAVTGGWVNDPQFVDMMGSPFLLAHGLGKPVADAVTQAEVPAAGSYRLWVRCRNWLPSHSPGTFRVLVGGVPSAVVFGKAPHDKWRWIDGGEFDLKPGKVQVHLKDLTGWWGRCDAVVLSAGAAPSNDPKTLAAQRIQYGGVSRDATRREYDVVVVGGGLAGCAAAVSAARNGCRVALVQDRPVLGGNASSEIQVSPGGDHSNEPLDPRETGIIEELVGPGRPTGQSERYERVVRGVRGLDLYLNTRATGTVMADKQTIAGVLAAHVKTGRRTLFAASLVIDCTGDGWVGFWAGAEFRHGREARSEFNEPLAPVKADSHTMGNTLKYARFREHARPVPFKAPPWAYRWTKASDFQGALRGVRDIHDAPAGFKDLSRGKGRRPTDRDGALGKWWVELGGMHDTIRDAEWIRDELFRVNLGLWNYAKNHNPKHRKANANRELVWLNYVPGKRESRRLTGDYILTQKDYRERIVHKDSVAYGGWGIDTHHPRGFWVKGVSWYSTYRHKVSIPYRCLYSKNISNLLMAGRDISVSHVALGGVRVMRTTCLMGQAAGTAAAVAHNRKTTARGVYRKHLAELQQTLLKDGCYLMGVKNADPADLALRATATASSSNPAMVLPNRGTIHDMACDRAVMFTAPADRIDSVELFLRNDTPQPKRIRLALRPAKALGDFSATKDLAAAAAAVPANHAGWVRFGLKARTEAGKLYYAWLPKTAGLKWDLFAAFPAGTSRAYRAGKSWKTMTGCYKYALAPGGGPSVPAKAPAAPSQVINGWNRAVRGVPNSWAPEPASRLPQWVQLDFGRPVAINCVHVSFQDHLRLAESFHVELWSDGKWRRAAGVKGNDRRRRVLNFERRTTSRLRLVLTKTRKDAAVCEIRVYDEPHPPRPG